MFGFKTLVAAMALTLVAGIPARAAEPADRIEAEIARIAEPIGGAVGVVARRLDGEGPRVSVNGDEPFPMASTFKVAVAGAILAKADAGELSLDRMVTVDPATHVASEVIADRFIHPGVSLSVHNLLELMLTQSDNTAADVLTELAGGPEAVTAWVRAQGVENLRVDRNTAELLRDFYDMPSGPFPDALAAAIKADPGLIDRSLLPKPEFDNDIRDTSTPEAMAKLLARMFNGKALSPESTQVLIETMRRNRTSGARFRARLPEGTRVADKTGTVGGSVNDVGVITLPGNGGRVILTVFIKKSAAPLDEREEAIADIARAVYDFYLFAG